MINLKKMTERNSQQSYLQQNLNKRNNSEKDG
jgi:hypothetical protein